MLMYWITPGSAGRLSDGLRMKSELVAAKGSTLLSVLSLAFFLYYCEIPGLVRREP